MISRKRRARLACIAAASVALPSPALAKETCAIGEAPLSEPRRPAGIGTPAVVEAAPRAGGVCALPVAPLRATTKTQEKARRAYRERDAGESGASAPSPFHRGRIAPAAAPDHEAPKPHGPEALVVNTGDGG